MHDRLPRRIDFRILAPQLVLGLALIAASDSHLVELFACQTRGRCAQTGFLEGSVGSESADSGRIVGKQEAIVGRV